MKHFKTRLKATDGRKVVLSISLIENKLKLCAGIQGSNKLKKIGEFSEVTIALGAPGSDELNYFFDILKS